ncbi:MAG TPA: bifunctional lysylphosphatidylglycerol flippase/synthetase MprF [Steroidobacteraceae bacterium]|nr:bifunctional lysylphosphatidylglycerol flippase/synthetase MprF [Steroidobacteraceae bacterium]
MTVPHTIRRVPAWTTLLGVALFGLALLWLHHVLAQYRWQDILAHVHAIPTSRLMAAVVLACSGYGCLTLYDALGLRFAGVRVPYPRLALISFMGFAIGHNVGLNTLTGGAIRYRAYSPLGLTAKQIGTVIAFGTLTFVLGAAVLLGLSLLSQAALSGSVLHVHPSVVVLAGCLLLGGVGAYLWLACSRHDSLRYGKIVIPVPSGRIAFAQVAVASTDLLCAAGVLYVLLPPQAAIGFTAFAGLYLIAISAGIISNVPGGVGVFESVLLLMFRSVPPDHLLGALLAYRIIYYFGPFTVALALLGAHEIWVHRGPMVRMGRLARTWLSAVTPQATGVAVFGAGAVLLFSGATPAISDRLEWLRPFVPLSILELSHLLGSAVGVGLMVLANGLYRRLDAAWWLTIWLLCAGVLLSLLKGFDYEEALILAALVVLLTSARSRFRRRTSLIEQRFSGPWIVAVLLVLGTSVWLVLFAYRNVPYGRELWWQFAFEASAPRSLRALLLAAMVAAAYGLWRLLRPSKPPVSIPGLDELQQAEVLIANGHDTNANLALLGDKHLMFNDDRTAFIMYQASGSSWVCMGDPVGPSVLCEPLAWEFLESCDGMAVSPVFYQVAPDNLSLYIDLGLTLTKLGEEARIPLRAFSLDGAGRADLRQSHRRAGRDGAEFSVVPRKDIPAIMPELRAVSDSWLAEKQAGEKRFSLGYFDERYLACFDCAVVRRGGAVVAFANIWKAGMDMEISVDLMRYSDAAPKGVIDFLLVECMLWGKAQKYQWFNLGMAPLSGLEEHALAPTWHKLGRMVQRYGETFYHFEGLRKYKEKFLPVWRPRYLAASGKFSVAGALLDVTSLISGGVGKALKK